MLLVVFQKTLAEEVSQLLKSENIIYIKSSEKSIHEFVKSLKTLKPDKVLALGQYYGRDRKFLRIETDCHKSSEKLTIPYFFRETDIIKFGKNQTGLCNMLSYEIASHYPHLPFTFLHIPKGFSKEVAAEEIRKQLNND